MSRWVIVIKNHLVVDKDDPLVDVCPVESCPKAKEILARYYSDFVEYYRRRNAHRPLKPFDVKIEWDPERYHYFAKLVIKVYDPQNKENLSKSYEVRRTIGVQKMEWYHRGDVTQFGLEPVIQ